MQRCIHINTRIHLDTTNFVPYGSSKAIQILKILTGQYTKI